MGFGSVGFTALLCWHVAGCFMLTGDSDTCIMHGFKRCEVVPCMEADVCYHNVLYLDVVHVFVGVYRIPLMLS